MRRHTLRYLALFGVLLVGVVGAFDVWPWPDPEAVGSEGAILPAVDVPMHFYHVDVASWYAATADEVVVVSHHDLGMATLHDALPMRLAEWQGHNLGPSGDISELYNDPPLVLRRQLVDAEGHTAWLTAIGAVGAKSYRIFEHTPHICYESTDWDTLEDRVDHVALAKGGDLPVRYGLFQHQGTLRLVYYWFQREGPESDASGGTISWRVTTDADDGLAAAEDRLDDLVRTLYERTVTWHRF